MAKKGRAYNGIYEGEYLSRIAFPMGGIGAGMICLEGTGTLSHLSIRNKPDVFNEPCVFAALCIKGEKNVARVLEGPVPMRKAFGDKATGNGASGRTYGLPRFAKASFWTKFPFSMVALADRNIPFSIEVTGWSPFIPANDDDSSLPMAGMEYTFRSHAGTPVEAVFSWNARNFMETVKGRGSVRAIDKGFVLYQSGSDEKPWEEGAFAVATDDPSAQINCAWFRGGWWDPLTLAWKDVEQGACYSKPPITQGDASSGATIFVPMKLKPGETKTIKVMLSWYVPKSDMRFGKDPEEKTACGPGCGCGGKTPAPQTYSPWYIGKFESIEKVAEYWRQNYSRLRDESRKFSECFYDTTLPPEVVEAIAANLTILKSPTVLRQMDGRIWAWEGCGDENGCCHGTCTHVWNYAQAMPHMFPALERTLRLTEFCESQNEKGHQAFRSGLPIRQVKHDFHAAADGQLGGIMKVYREWRISGDTEWLKRLWALVKQSMDYCIETWDPGHKGIVEEPHHNTYDIEFWGPDGMCGSFYLGALKAAALMGKAMGDDVSLYEELLKKGRKYIEKELFNGEYFYQQVKWEGLRAGSPLKGEAWNTSYSPEAAELLQKEGPKYQYGKGCLADGVLGAWIADVCGVGEVLSPGKVKSHLKAVFKYNFKKDLFEHANPQRPAYALGHEAGLILCTWPKGERPTLPMVYCDEVWTGFEYQAAAHLMTMGRVREGLEIVRGARDRYDGRVRNPFNEYECGHWYARAMSSYGMIQGLTGVRYDAVEKVLYVKPRISGDFRSFLSTATGYGTVGVKDGKPFVEVKQGRIDVQRTEYEPA